MKQWYMIIDVALCHDCNNCLMACKDEHVDNDWPGYTAPQPRHGHRWIDILRRERGQCPRVDVAYLPMSCQHCENPPCQEAHPEAVIRRPDGIVLLDPEKAKGKRDLVDSCPYGAIWWNEELQVAQKCTLCAHLLDDRSWMPGVPRCVHTCPTGAMELHFLEQEELEELAREQKLEAYRPELGTKPHVLYRNLYRFTTNFISAGVLLDGECFEGATVTLRNAGPGSDGLPGRRDNRAVATCGTVATCVTNCFGDFKFDGLGPGTYKLEICAAGRSYSTTVTLGGESLNLGFIQL
ncbi:MAG: oxidoreductase [Thermoleophilia bacterium]|nr:oxidoreductase [Thermoleophilia bacterium]